MIWQTKKLGEVCSVFVDGDWIEKKDQSSEGIRLIQTGNIGNGFFKDRGEKARYISGKTFKRLRCTEILPTDCLISRLPDPVGRACILPETGEKMITAVDCTILRFQKEVLPLWFVYYSLSQEYQTQIDKEVLGSTRQRISRNNLGLIEIPLPPLTEQKRIVKILDEVFEGIEKARGNAEKNLKNSQELFESYLQGVFANRGKDWGEKTLNEISENLDSKRIPITKRVRSSGKYPYYGASGIVDNVGEYIFDDNLLLVSEDGANLLARTYPIAFSVSGKSWVNNHAHVLKFEKVESQKFVEYYLNSIKLDPYVSGMAQPKLNQKMLNSIPIPYPPFSDQKAIVKKLDALAGETKKLETVYRQKIADLDELKKSVLKKAFGGEL